MDHLMEESKLWGSSYMGIYQVPQSDPFEVSKWPFFGLKWPWIHGWKGHFEEPRIYIYTYMIYIYIHTWYIYIIFVSWFIRQKNQGFNRVVIDVQKKVSDSENDLRSWWIFHHECRRLQEATISVQCGPSSYITLKDKPHLL